MADFRLYRGDEVYVTGDPGEASKLLHVGWSTEPPKPVYRPRPVTPKQSEPKTAETRAPESAPKNDTK